MGHIHLGVLPGTRKWRDVVSLLGNGASAEDVAQASAIAVEKELRAAANDGLFVECIRLLAMIPLAARSEDFARAMRDVGIPVGDNPGLMEILSAMGKRLDRFALEHGHRSDFGELARRSLLSTLTAQISDQLPGLFGATPSDVQTAARRLSNSNEFSHFARNFFTKLLSSTLSSWLDRTLSAQVGTELRFTDIGARSHFDSGLGLYCVEATRIIREFSGGWYGKTVHRDGKVTTTTAAAYGAVAFKKITEELQRKRGAHAWHPGESRQ